VGYTGGMRAVVIAFAAAGLLTANSPARAAPPDDIAAYCRTVHPQVPFQVRCLNLENAAAARVGRTGPGPDPAGWNRCRSSSPSWSAMEQCLAESAQAPQTPPAVGAEGTAAAPGERAPATATVPSTPGDAPPPAAPAPTTAAPAPAAPPATSPPPSSTVILGPRPTPTPPSERERQTRAISEADADRQMRSVMEQNPSARCTKKQYGPGWVITCE
jgi:hypothetical protein